MLISLSGTPGTGKTSTAMEFDPRRFEIVSMNTLTDQYTTGVDEGRESIEIDIDRLINDVKEGKFTLPHGKEKGVVIEGHLSHHLPVDKIIVLRTSTGELKKRLMKRSYDNVKIRENMEAEAMGVISLEALETDCPMYEVDTTHLSPWEAAQRCRDIILNRSPAVPGPNEIIDFTEEILEWY